MPTSMPGTSNAPGLIASGYDSGACAPDLPRKVALAGESKWFVPVARVSGVIYGVQVCSVAARAVWAASMRARIASQSTDLGEPDKPCQPWTSPQRQGRLLIRLGPKGAHHKAPSYILRRGPAPGEPTGATPHRRWYQLVVGAVEVGGVLRCLRLSNPSQNPIPVDHRRVTGW